MNRRTFLMSAGAVAAARPVAAAPGPIGSAAGTGEQGYSGDGGPAISARLDQPFHCCKDGRGNLFVADTFNHCIRRVDVVTGAITTVAGSGKKGYTGDGGPAAAATLNEPYGVLAGAAGNLYIVDRLNYCIRVVDGQTGRIRTLAGVGTPGYSGDGGPAERAAMREPNALELAPDGALYIADVRDCRIRRVDLSTGIITTAAGTGRREFSGDGGPAAEASINGARGVAFDQDGVMYICEREGNRIRRVDPESGVIQTIAGTGRRGYEGDGGPALMASFNGPKWIHVGPDGRLYIVDTENHCVRRIDLGSGEIRTVAGGRRGPGGDGGAALDAEMDRPHGCWVDPEGRLYTGDTNNHRIRVNWL